MNVFRQWVQRFTRFGSTLHHQQRRVRGRLMRPGRVSRPENACEALESRVLLAVSTVSVSDVSLVEGNSGQQLMNFTLARSGDMSPAVLVRYATVDGTAIAGEDYVAQTGTALIPANASSFVVSVPVLGDAVIEGDESFNLNLLAVDVQGPAIGLSPSTVTLAGAGNTNPKGVAAGDLNGDGQDDLVLANYGADSISVLLNNTAPGATSLSWETPVTFAADRSPKSVTLGDLNGDGRLDVVVGNNTGASVSVFINTTTPGNSTPSFATRADFTAGAQVYSVAVADLNRDGKLDLVATRFGFGVGKVSTYLNSGTIGSTTPSFSAPQHFDTGSSPVGLAVADFNGDGLADVAVANYGATANSVSVLLNTTPAGGASANFAARADFAVGNRARAVAVGDLNRDGQLDLAVANQGSDTVSVLLNSMSPGAAVASFAARQDVSTGTQPYSLSISDLNGDGKLDLSVATKGSPNAVQVFANRTIAGELLLDFVSPSISQGPSQVTVGIDPTSVVTADLNLDGVPDLVTVNSADNTLSWLRNSTSLTSTLPDYGVSTFNIAADGGNSPRGTVADFNNDGKPDLASIDMTNNRLSVRLNTTTAGAETATFGTRTSFVTDTQPISIAVADINLDGRPDLVVSNEGSSSVSVFMNTTTAGASTASFATRVSYPISTGTPRVGTGDFNGDGKPDVAVIIKRTSSFVVSVLFNQTAPGSAAPSLLPASDVYTVPSNPNPIPNINDTFVEIGDLNGDGRDDILVTYSELGGPDFFVPLINNTGLGSFTPAFVVTGPLNAVVDTPSQGLIADLNSDGQPDLALPGTFGALPLALFRNTTSPGSTTVTIDTGVTITPGGQYLRSVAAADLTGDYRPDLVLTTDLGNRALIMTNGTLPGSATFSLTQTPALTTGNSPHGLALADFNLDGRPDFVTFNAVSLSASVFLARRAQLGATTAVGTIVNDDNSPPTLQDIPDQVTDEDVNLGPLNFTIGDIDATNPNLTMADPLASLLLSATSSNPSLLPVSSITFGGSVGNRQVTLRPLANQSGTSLVSVIVRDLHNNSTTDTFVLTVNPVNDLPVISNIADLSIYRDQTAGPVTFLVNDIETPVTLLAVTATSSNPALIPDTNLTLNGSTGVRSITLAPLAGATGTALITLAVDDGTGGISSDTFVLSVIEPATIQGRNWIDFNGNGARDLVPFEPGLAGVSMYLDTNNNQQLDSGEPFTLTRADNIATVGLDESGEYAFPLLPAGTYAVREVVPPQFVQTAPGIHGVIGGRGYRVTVTAGQVLSNLDFANQPLNSPPVNALGSTPYLGSEDLPLSLTDLAIQDLFPLNGLYTTVLEVTLGTLQISPTVAGGLTSDDIIGNGTSQVTLAGTLAAINATLAASDAVVFTPPAQFQGDVTLTITTGDNGNTGFGAPLSDSDTQRITIAPVNDPPSALPQTGSTPEETPLSLTLAGLDGDADVVQTLTFAITQQPQFGTISAFNPATGEVTYIPGTDFFGTDSFVFTVTDDTLAGGPAVTSSPAVVTIQVAPLNDSPTLSDLSPVNISEDSSSGPIAFTVGDVDSPLSALTLAVTSSNPGLIPAGNVLLSGSGASYTCSVTPITNAFGTAIITLTADDNSGGRVSTSFVVTVLPVNDAPTFTPGTAVTAASNAGAVTVASWATGMSPGPANESGQLLSFQVGNSNPALFAQAPALDPLTGNLTFTPRADQFGSATVSVRLRDNGGTSQGGTDTSLLHTFTLTVTVPSTRRFEFNASPSLQTAGYTSVRGTDIYDAITGPVKKFGWNSAVTEADRPTLAANSLLRDGHYGRDNTFTAELPNGTYRVSLVLGDRSFARDRLNVYANGVLVPELTNISTAAGQFLQRSFTATVTSGRLDLRLRDMGGDPFWMLHAIEVRPLADVENQLTISRVTSLATSSLPGDGTTVDQFLGQGAVPDSLITVSPTAGVFPAGQDQDTSFAGVQVRADAQGQFSFRLQRPYATTDIAATLSVEDVTGARSGRLAQTYGQPAARLFDMNTTSSPTSLGYLGVTNRTLFSTAQGYGWQRAVNGADRGTASSPDQALRDLAYGSDGTFRILVNPGEAYQVTLRFRDTFAHDKINVYLEGSTTPVSPGLTNLLVPANTTVVETFTASSNDGILDIRFRDLSTTGDRNWILNALELRRSPLPSPTLTDTVFAVLPRQPLTS